MCAHTELFCLDKDMTSHTAAFHSAVSSWGHFCNDSGIPWSGPTMAGRLRRPSASGRWGCFCLVCCKWNLAYPSTHSCARMPVFLGWVPGREGLWGEGTCIAAGAGLPPCPSDRSGQPPFPSSGPRACKLRLFGRPAQLCHRPPRVWVSGSEPETTLWGQCFLGLLVLGFVAAAARSPKGPVRWVPSGHFTVLERRLR